MNQRAIDFVKAFVAGFVSTLVFHQGLLTLFYLAAVVPRAPYDLRAVPPLDIPAAISLAFWGGAWGVAIWPLLKNVNGPAYWVRAQVISAIASGSVTLESPKMPNESNLGDYMVWWSGMRAPRLSL